VLQAVLQAKLSAGVLLLPLFFFVICCTVCLLALQVGKRVLGRGPLSHILAFSTGSGNSGYFGLPVAIALFGQTAAPWVILCALGFILYENSLGFFVTARGHHTWHQSVRRVLGLPSIYAFLLAVALNLGLGYQLSPSLTLLADGFRGAYSI